VTSPVDDGLESRRDDPERAQRYDAFMSYSHDDSEVAAVLQLQIQRFAKPWYRLRGVRIFRDRASMAAHPRLWSAIERSLAASRCLILLASPSAAQSSWVRRELQYWLHNKSADTILIALIGGDIAWGPTGTGFDTARTTALPSELAERFAVEPRYVDLRWVPAGTAPLPNDPRLRDAVADLAAPLHGRSKDEIIGEDVQQHRTLLVWRNAAIAVLSVLLLLSATLTVVAVQRGNQLEDELAAADATVLGEKARTVEVSDPAAATQFALAAYRSDPTSPQARTALVDRYLAEQSVTAVHAHVTNGVILAVQQSTAGDTTRIDAADGTTVHRQNGGIQDGRWAPPLAPGARSILSPDGSWLISQAYDGTYIAWNTQAGFGSVLFNSGSSPVPDHVSTAFSGDSRLVAIVTPQESDESQSQAAIWDLTRQPLATKVAEFSLPYRYKDVNQLAVTTDATSLLISTDGSGPQGYGTTSRADLWRLTAGHPPAMTGLPPDSAFRPDGTEYYVCTAGYDNSNGPTRTVIRAIDTATGATNRTIGLGTNGGCPARTADGEHVVMDHTVAPPNTSTRAVIVSLLTGKAYDVTVPADSRDLPPAAAGIAR
jgi:TIR domain